MHFYPRSPCGERPPQLNKKPLQDFNFYPRSPCGERRRQGCRLGACICISIHALLAESDSCMILTQRFCVYFYPRSPCGERRLYISDVSGLWHDFYPRSPCGERQALGLPGWLRTLISIHALLAESDGRCRCWALSDK